MRFSTKTIKLAHLLLKYRIHILCNFALVGIIHRFHYLKYGLSLVLMVVGAKMLINAAFGKVIPTEAALLVTAVLIGGSMLVSIIKTRRLPKEMAAAEAAHGWVPGSPAKEKSGENSLPKDR